MMRASSLGWRNLTRPKPSPRRMTSRLKLGVSGPQGGPGWGTWAAAEELRDSKIKKANNAGAVTPTSNLRFCMSILLWGVGLQFYLQRDGKGNSLRLIAAVHISRDLTIHGTTQTSSYKTTFRAYNRSPGREPRRRHLPHTLPGARSGSPQGTVN